MLFDLPDHDRLYRALVDRDEAYDGHAFVCVASTGIFCRLTCPARKPKPENCSFKASVTDCLEAGYRPCKRCHPMGPMAQADPSVTALIDALDRRPDHRWREDDIKALGFDVSTVRRAFKRQFGMTFLEMARQRRLREGFETIAGGGAVIEGQLDAGFESASAFRVAFAKLIGKAPGALSTDPLLYADWIATPLGDMLAVACRSQLHLLEFFDRKVLPRELVRLDQFAKGRIGLGQTDATQQIRAELDAYFKGDSAQFKTPFACHGSDFTKRVWEQLCQIPAGETRSYGQIARAIGQPTATRAVARANGANQIALVIPCHRVIGADGSLTGYGGGLWRKQKLIEIERHYRNTSKEMS